MSDIAQSIPIVIDSGSSVCKAALANIDPYVDFPSIFSSVVGHTEENDNFFVGDGALGNPAVVSLSFPIERGIIVNDDDMIKVWRHVYEQLDVSPEEHPIMLTEVPMNPANNKDKMAQIMFDTFNAQAIYIANQALLPLCNANFTTGILLVSGDGVTYTVPIYERSVQSHAIGRLEMAGRDVTDYLTKALVERGYFTGTSVEREIVRGIKETNCVVKFDYEKAISTTTPSTRLTAYERYEGDEQGLALGTEIWTSFEALFKPSFIDKNCVGIHELLHNSILKCDNHMRNGMYANILLYGSSTLITGFNARLEKEIAILAPHAASMINAAGPSHREYGFWVFGAKKALELPMDEWVSKSEYSESGASIVHRKCR